jgi:hypothetical protein
MTFPLAVALVTVKAPEAYSFWASMMTSAESVDDAVLAGMPKMERKDCAIFCEGSSEVLVGKEWKSGKKVEIYYSSSEM